MRTTAVCGTPSVEQRNEKGIARPRTPRAVWSFRLPLYALLLGGVALGGPVTKAASGAALLLSILGDCDGLVRHLFKLAGLGLGLWLAPGLGGPLGERFAPLLGVPILVGCGIGMAVAGIAIIFVMGMIGRVCSRLVRRRAAFNGADHVLGGLLGGAEGVLVVATVCWGIVTFGEPLARAQQQAAERGFTTDHWAFARLDALRTAVRDDPAGQLFTRVNPLPGMPAVQAVQQVVEVASSPGAFTAALKQNETMREFTRMPVVRQHLDAFEGDELIQAAIKRGDMGAVLRSPQFAAMLNDHELYETVTGNWHELRDALGDLSIDQVRNAAAGGRPDAGMKAVGRDAAHVVGHRRP
ncbi:MAG: CvpA family protein [Planctomycetes bacterium]|nr:CvpA family protein [Planctomycetota bacterium]